ncbi:MAG: hypothetical protein NZ789_01745, partial [Pseudomonadales bacterium]|nr:hypothetical protein [Pseudomonadales bacterium]
VRCTPCPTATNLAVRWDIGVKCGSNRRFTVHLLAASDYFTERNLHQLPLPANQKLPASQHSTPPVGPLVSPESGEQ